MHDPSYTTIKNHFICLKTDSRKLLSTMKPLRQQTTALSF